MSTKEQLAEEYADNVTGLDYIGNAEVEIAFKAGWDAAVNYLAKLPFDKMLKYFNEVLNDVTMEEVIEENKDVLKRLKDKSI